MKLWIVTVGRPGGGLAAAIGAYEARAARYWKLESVEVKGGAPGGRRSSTDVREAEGARILDRLPEHAEVIALTRQGLAWSSRDLARHLDERRLSGQEGSAFVIGGADGLASAVLERARVRLSLSPMTLPHDLARLVLMEQLYRAGTILRGEPYHKGGEGA
ncbi:MAG: 23S rRNA (pseudouridine(1915)-N(3))-methyltransferase RlmH [Gemmatimonadota bacterium]